MIQNGLSPLFVFPTSCVLSGQMLRVSIIDNFRFLTASAEVAARPVVVIREAIAAFFIRA